MAESQASLEVPEGPKSRYGRWVKGEGVPVIKTFFADRVRCEEPIVREWFSEALAQRGV